jgi:hypothetical protein
MIERFWRVSGKFANAEIFEGGRWVPAKHPNGEWSLCHKLSADMKARGQLNLKNVANRIGKPSGSDDWSDVEQSTVDKRMTVISCKIVREEREYEVDPVTDEKLRMISQNFVTEATMGDA